MSLHSESQTNSRLLPIGWYKALWVYARVDFKDAFIFVMLNIGLGTCGLWLPLAYAALGPGEPGNVFSDLLASGAVYLFVIPFVASVTYTTIHSLLNASEGETRKQYIIYLVVLFLLCFLVAFLVATQLAPHNESSTLKNSVQIVVSIVATFTAVLVFCLIRIDISQSIPDDLNKRAKSLAIHAQAATSNREDFE